jgi:hypothetical protein
MINKFDELMLEIKNELLALKTVKKTASPLISFVRTYTDTTSTTGKHYRLTFGGGNQPIFCTFTCSRASVIYVFRTPNGNTQLLDVYDLSSSGSATFIFGSTRTITNIEEL